MAHFFYQHANKIQALGTWLSIESLAPCVDVFTLVFGLGGKVLALPGYCVHSGSVNFKHVCVVYHHAEGFQGGEAVAILSICS